MYFLMKEFNITCEVVLPKKSNLNMIMPLDPTTNLQEI